MIKEFIIKVKNERRILYRFGEALDIIVDKIDKLGEDKETTFTIKRYK